MTDKEAIDKAMSYNSNLTILSINRNNGLKFEILCPDCGGKKENLVVMSSIKSDKLSCKKCRGNRISKKLQTPQIENSFANNDYYNRLNYWDYNKNLFSPNEIYQHSGRKAHFICEKGHNFETSIDAVNKGCWCIHCSNLLKESKLATTLKQVFKYEFENTVWEYDIGFKGAKGGKSSYDIFVPELNLIIECQSEYHDGEDRLEFDLIKKEFAINNGYNFIAIDYRMGNILNLVQIFFPFLNNIPDYVSYIKNTLVNWDIRKAQELLNNTNMNQKEVANEVGASISSLYEKVLRGILVVPTEKQIKIPVVKLNLEGIFISRYNSATECSVEGFNAPDICSCCKGNQHTHRGHLFMYEYYYNDIKDDFGNIPIILDYYKISNNANKKKVIQLSKYGDFINCFDSITDTYEKTRFAISNISACCNHISKTSNGFCWVYEEEYEENKNEFGNIDKETMKIISNNYNKKKVY